MRRRAILIVAVLSGVLAVCIIGALLFSSKPKHGYFTDGVRQQAYTFYAADYIHCEWQGCARCPQMNEMKVSIANISVDRTGPKVEITFTKPFIQSRVLRSSEAIRFLNPCTGQEEVIGKVERINPEIYWSAPQAIRRFGIPFSHFYVRSEVIIRFGDSWFTRMYGH